MSERIGDFEIVSISFLDETKRTSPRTLFDREIVTPRTPVQETIAEIWREILHADFFSIYDNFFELGGDSLMATQVFSRIRTVFAVEPPMLEMFQPATIVSMAEKVEAQLHAGRALNVPPLTLTPRNKPLPLSFSQERMWFIHQLDPQSAAYNVASAVRLTGEFDVEAYRRSVDAMVRRHESLRTVFPLLDGAPIQKILPPPDWDLPIFDLRNAAKEERVARAKQMANDFAQVPFNLAEGPLFRTQILRLDTNEYVLLMNMHHIISDAWSMGVFAREFLQFFEAYRKGETPNLPDLPVQYADFSVWQREWLKGDILEEHLAYWRDKLKGTTVLELPTDRPRPLIQTYLGSLQSVEPDAALFEALHAFSQSEGVTFFMTLLAAFDVLLYRYTAQNEVALGVPIANRNWLALENLIGAVVNTLIMRVDLSGNPTFRELVHRVRQVAVEAYAHQDMPFAKLVTELAPERNTSYTPFAQVMFNVINVPMPNAQMDKLTADPIEVNRGAAQFDLTCTVSDIPEFRRIVFDYNTGLFDDATIQRMLKHYLYLLRGVVENPDLPIEALPLLDDRERKQLLVEWNQTQLSYADDQTIHGLFERQAARTPDGVALIDRGQSITFDALNRRANRLAHELMAMGVTLETPVVIRMERSLDLVSAMLAVLKAGGAYVPLGATYPAARMSFILQDTHAPVVLTTLALSANLPPSGAKVMLVDIEGIKRADDTNPKVGVTPDNLACIVYTSGSTGQPKGVLELHRGAVNRFASMADRLPFGVGEIACFKSPFTFVDSILELFAPLTHGVPVAVLSDAVARDARLLVEALAKHNVTRLIIVPSLLQVMLETQTNLAQQLPCLMYWLASGEVISPALREMFYEKLPDAALFNVYGASEASGDSTMHDTRTTRHLPFVPIGRAIANTQLYVVDRHERPVPIGVQGELYVGGVSLARGYLQQPQLTAEKFVPLPFADETVYRTGDIVSYLPDGALRFWGRRDRQIKVRGMRVEAGEIEKTFKTHPQVVDALVILRTDNGRDVRLAGYVTANHGHAPDTQELRRHLRDHLPEYMVPQDIVVLDEFPLTSSGKIDRLRLPAVAPGSARTRESNELMLAQPSNVVERELQEVWERELGITPIGMDDDFFALGGHSLLAIRLFAEIEKKFGQTIPVATIFREPTIRSFAQVLQKADSNEHVWSPLVPIQPQGSLLPFFCVHGLGGGVADYAFLARHLGNDQPFFGLQAYGLEPGQSPDTTIGDMAERFIRAIRQAQLHGPYALGGYSYGGTVAYEIACRLVAQGERVELLAMFDHPAPHSSYGDVTLNRQFLTRFLQNLPHWASDYWELSPTEKWRRITARWHRARRIVGAPSAVDVPYDLTDYIDDVSHIPLDRRSLMQVHLNAVRLYTPNPYPGCVTVFRTLREPLFSSYDPHLGWDSLARGGVEVLPIAGFHRNLLQEPHVQTLAAQLGAALRRARELA